MRIAEVTLKSVSPYSSGRYHGEPKIGPEEHADKYEERTWRLRLHTDTTGQVIIPGIQVKKALDYTAKRMGEKISGKGNRTWTKHFESGVMALDDLRLGVNAADVPGEWIYVNADGVRGSGKRVLRCFPFVSEWEAKMQLAVLDDAITEEIFERYINEAGKFDGLGRWRPARGGMKGRFEVKKIKWS